MKKEFYQNINSVKFMLELFTKSNEGILITDSQKKILLINPSYEKMTNFTSEEILNKNAFQIILKNVKEEKIETIEKNIERNNVWKGEITKSKKNGEEIPVALKISKFKNEKNNNVFYVFYIKEIKKKNLRYSKLEYLANNDSLTNIPNRLFFSKSVSEKIKTTNIEEKFAIAFIDLDGFKEINDTYGHIVGDNFLKKIAEKIKNTLREEDIVARYGGDEFILMLSPIKNEFSAEKIIRNIMKIFEEPLMELETKSLKASMSIGVSIFPEHGKTIEELIKKADFSMYVSKKNGKNNFHIFNEDFEKSENYKIFTKN